jgi:hypothetical protein
VSDPDANVQLLKEEGKIEITRKGAKEPLTISVAEDKHSLKVQTTEFDLLVKTFEMKPGTRRAIAAKWVPVEDEPDAEGASPE